MSQVESHGAVVEQMQSVDFSRESEFLAEQRLVEGVTEGVAQATAAAGGSGFQLMVSPYYTDVSDDPGYHPTGFPVLPDVTTNYFLFVSADIRLTPLQILKNSRESKARILIPSRNINPALDVGVES